MKDARVVSYRNMVHGTLIHHDNLESLCHVVDRGLVIDTLRASNISEAVRRLGNGWRARAYMHVGRYSGGWTQSDLAIFALVIGGDAALTIGKALDWSFRPCEDRSQPICHVRQNASKEAAW